MYFKEDARITDEEYLKTYNIFKVGDIAFEGNKSNDFSHGRFVENTIGDGIVSHVFVVFRPLHDTHNLRYWKYAINNESVMGRILARCTKKTTMMTNLVTKDFLNQTILCPSAQEQDKIANLLDGISERIKLQKLYVESLKKYKRGLQNRFFFKRSHLSPKASEIDSHDVEPLGSVVHINPKTGSLPEAFIYIDLECVESGVLNSKKLISRNSAPSRAQRLLEEGDLLYQMVRPYQKNNYYFQKGFEYPTVASTGYAQIRCSEMDTQFIYEQLSSDYFAREAMLRSTGTGYPAINADDLAEIPIWVPPLNQQEKIGAALSSLGEKIEVHQKLLSALCSVKFSLLQQLFI